MRHLSASTVTESVKKLCIEANFELPQDVLDRIIQMRDHEESSIARYVLDQIIENAAIAKKNKLPLCQDTGFAVLFLEKGRDLVIDEPGLEYAIDEGVSKGYTESYLRPSILKDPLDRNSNTSDNTPPIIWCDTVDGDKLTITFIAKGGGSENMSRLEMLTPLDGLEGVFDFVLNTIKKAGGNPCPPVVVGVGIGGTIEKCAQISKKALLRKFGSRNPNPKYAELETRLLDAINKTGIGPMGLGGKTTALEVFIETHPCHIASLPVAVNFNCHSSRHKTVVL